MLLNPIIIKKGNYMKKSILSLVALAALTMSANATDYRAEKPEAWTTKNVYNGETPTEKGVEAAIKALYGDVKPVESDEIKLKAPKVASNGGAIPVSVKTDIPAKSIAILQDANPEALVIVYNVVEGSEADYSLKIKMKKSGAITAVVEGKDGKIYSKKLSLEVALGGCEG